MNPTSATSSTSCPRKRYCNRSRQILRIPRVEPEIAFLLNKPLLRPNVTVAEVYVATEAVAIALGIVGSRIIDWRLTLADNASSGAVVLGEWVPWPTRVEHRKARVLLRPNDSEVDSGFGTAVMGDPAAALAWLANALTPYGTEIMPGQFVLSGSMTTAVRVDAGDHTAATIDELGTVSVHLARAATVISR